MFLRHSPTFPNAEQDYWLKSIGVSQPALERTHWTTCLPALINSFCTKSNLIGEMLLSTRDTTGTWVRAGLCVLGLILAELNRSFGR